MRKIVKIYISRLDESNQKTTFFVNLQNDEGLVMSPSSFRTGDVSNNHQGLSIRDARERVLLEAADQGDFLEVEVTPYVEEGITYQPEDPLETYTTNRILAQRDKEENKRQQEIE